MFRDPFDEIRRLEARLNRLFEELRGRPFWGPKLLPGEKARGREIEPYREPSLDIMETEKEILVTAEMPGLDKKDISLNLTEDRLEISTETKREAEEEREGYIYRERMGGRFYRAISLPSPVDPRGAKASYKNGVLEIKMPKTEVKKKTRLDIE
jgi:HSP20 family protein